MKTYRIKKIFEGHKWNQRNVYKSYSDNPLSYKLCKNSTKYFNGQINGSFHLNKSLFEHENNLTSLASISFVARFNRYCAQRKPWRSSNTKMSKIRFHQFPFVSPNVMLPTLFFSLTYWNFSGISYEERSTYILKLRVTHVRKKYLFLAVNISVSVLWKVLIKEVSGEGLEGGVNQTEWTLSQTFQLWFLQRYCKSILYRQCISTDLIRWYKGILWSCEINQVKGYCDIDLSSFIGQISKTTIVTNDSVTGNKFDIRK